MKDTAAIAQRLHLTKSFFLITTILTFRLFRLRMRPHFNTKAETALWLLWAVGMGLHWVWMDFLWVLSVSENIWPDACYSLRPVCSTGCKLGVAHCSQVCWKDSFRNFIELNFCCRSVPAFNMFQKASLVWFCYIWLLKFSQRYLLEKLQQLVSRWNQSFVLLLKFWTRCILFIGGGRF